MNGLKDPLVSIITVCFNSEKTIVDTVYSVNKQNYKNLEHIIIDGNSSDDTILRYKSSIKLKNYKIISETDDGIYDAMNKGIRIAKGEIICILNSDDVYTSGEVISNIVNCFKQNNCEAIYTNMKIVSSDLKKTIRIISEKKYDKKRFEFGWHPPHPSLFLRRSVYENFGNFNTSFKIASDFEFMWRVIYENNLKVKFLSTTSTLQRIGGASTNSLKSRYIGNKEIFCFLKNSVGFYKTLKIFIGRFYLKLNQFYDR